LVKQKIGKQRLKEIKAKFAIFDADNSGQINAAELATVLRAVGLNPTEHHVQELLEEYDADNSGALSFAEFARLYVEELESVEEADKLFKNAFQFFDKDGNGEISLVEFREVLTQLGDPMGDDEVSLFFKLVDRNNDGKLQYDEFLEMVLEGTSQGTPGKKKGRKLAAIMANGADAPGSPGRGARRDKAAAATPSSGGAPKRTSEDAGAVSPPGTVNAKR